MIPTVVCVSATLAHCRFNLNCMLFLFLRVMLPPPKKLLVPCGHFSINNSVSHSFWDIKAITANNKDHSWAEQQPLLPSVLHNTLPMQLYLLKQGGCWWRVPIISAFVSTDYSIMDIDALTWWTLKISGCSTLRSFLSAVIYGCILFYFIVSGWHCSTKLQQQLSQGLSDWVRFISFRWSALVLSSFQFQLHK